MTIIAIQKTVTRVFKFDAAHYLPDYPGKCADLHGHTWEIEIEAAGVGPQFPTEHHDGSRPRFYEGILLDFSDMKKIMEPILEQLDHRVLNEVIERPTAENLVSWLVAELYEIFILVRVRVYENVGVAWAEWKQIDEGGKHV